MKVPGFILNRLIVKGSFRRFHDSSGAPAGFELEIRNRLGAGVVEGCSPIVIDGKEYPLERLTIEKGGASRKADEVSPSSPLAAPNDEKILLRVHDCEPIPDGRHTIRFGITLQGFGPVEVEYRDRLITA